MDLLTSSQIRKINKTALAEKYKPCSAEYVTQILSGKRKANSKKAKAILEDANEIIAVLEGTKPKI